MSMEKIRKNACQLADIGYLEVGRCMEDKVGEPKTGTKGT